MANVRARALLFVALNAVAVPSCQHYDGDGTSRDRQALAGPPAAPSAVPVDPRMPLPPRA